MGQDSQGPSLHEIEARQRKVAAITATARAHGITADQAERLDGTGRNALAALAGARPPSATTWTGVLEALRHLEAHAVPADPFEGLDR